MSKQQNQNEVILFEFDASDMKQAIKDKVIQHIKKGIELHEDKMHDAIRDYFHRAFYNDKAKVFDSEFTSALQELFEQALREEFERLNVKQIIAKEIATILTDEKRIKGLAKDLIERQLNF